MATAGRRIRVLICNQYTLFREGIKALLEKGTPIEVVGEADTAAEAIEQLKRLKPDVVLMDVGTPDLTGFEATRRIKAVDPHVKILILSVHQDEVLISRCLEAGASGYIRKYDRAAQLQSAIDAVCHVSERAA
jgi:DNA-binding NarL/FixJ family response regulator